MSPVRDDARRGDAAPGAAPQLAAPREAATGELEPEEPQGPPPVALSAPRDGVPPVVTDPEALNHAAQSLAAGTGPVAVDAERASGYRYGSRAFLVQLRREGAGTILIDPGPLPDLSVIGKALGDTEWVLHAASQDLPCLAECGLRPGGELFDTELGARIAGYPKVGLAAVTERLLGLTLAKEHSAVDWSTRPLPQTWLTYAALDVELLVALRDELAADLDRQGKLDWARQEFSAVRDATPPAPRRDPWRRTSGISQLRNRRQLGVLRELWSARDNLAQRRDIAPGRVLPDRSLIAAATAMPKTEAALTALPAFSGSATRRHAKVWARAIQRGLALPDSQLPPQHLRSEGPPPARVWKLKAPEAFERLSRAREVIDSLSESHQIPVENLLTPDLLRRLVWDPPAALDEAAIRAALTASGARGWQTELVAPPLAGALSSTG